MICIDEKKCNACGLCEKTCPFSAIAVRENIAVVNEACTGCGTCINICPSGAISIFRKAAPLEELSKYKGVLIWAECETASNLTRPKKVVYELLTRGRRLADKLKNELAVVMIGDERLAGFEDLGAYGADRILLCRHPLLQRFTVDGFCQVLSTVIADRKPSVVLYGATPNGRELAPRVAARLRLGLTADCTELDIDTNGQLVQTRPAFGGNIMASIIAPHTRPQTATVRPNVFTAEIHDPNRKAEIEEIAPHLFKASIRTQVVEEVIIESRGANLEEAQIIIAAGRGCSEETDLTFIKQLADRLGGSMAGSRPLVEEGKISHTQQVGQSGLTVAPELYMAFGISGAVQHLVGMSASKIIIAVDKDPDAAIFKNADLGIVGDAKEVLPALLQLLEKQKKSSRVAV